MRWNKSTKAAFIRNLSEVLDEPAMMQLSYRMASVQGYRMRRRDDPLFMLKTAGESFAESWDEILRANPNAPREEAQDAFLVGMSSYLYTSIGLNKPSNMDEAIQSRVLLAKLTVAAKAAEDPNFLSGETVEAAVRQLTQAHLARTTQKVAKALKSEALGP